MAHYSADTKDGKLTFSAWRRRVQVGTVLEAVGHYNPNASGLRTVTKKGSTGFWWSGEKIGRSWLAWPKAAQVKLDGPDTVTFMFEDGNPMTTLTVKTTA